MQKGQYMATLANGIGGNKYGSLGDYEKEIEFQRQSLSIAKDIGNKKVQNAKHIPTLVMTHTNVPVITEEQSSFISSPSVRTAKEIGEKG